MAEPRFIVIPLDARPVCYEQVLDLAQIAGLQVSLPPTELLGVLKQPAPVEALFSWWEQHLTQNPEAVVILSLDTLAYGGLIASRVNTEPLEVLQERSQRFLQVLKQGHRPRYGFSSILRIPSYDNAEEEPDYWATYGSQLYQMSVETHQQGSMPRHFFNEIPGDVIRDFLGRREKNFNRNKSLLSLLESRTLDLLVFCQDDTGPYGLNVKEADVLKGLLQKQRLQPKSFVQTGADEVALTLMARSLWANKAKPLKVFPWFFPEHGKKVMALFDGIPLSNVVQRQIQTIGGIVCLNPEDADLILLINAPSDTMGDHCAQKPIARDRAHIPKLVETLQKWLPEKSVAIADVVFANGGDPLMMNACLEKNVPLENLAAYAAWNTPGNAIGCALAMGAVVVWAHQNQRLNDEARRKLLLKRLLDDWYYQADVRLRLRKQFQALPPVESLNAEMAEGAMLLKLLLDLPSTNPSFTFPCQRTFEIAVHV